MAKSRRSRATKKRARTPGRADASSPMVLTERDETARSTTNWGAVQHRTHAPSWSDVRAAIERLDGRGYTDVMLTTGAGDDAVNLSVSGGLEGHVICAVARPDHPEWAGVLLARG
jgi:hypothetical protein